MAASGFRTRFVLPGTINWFPGHMAKAARDMRSKLRHMDLVVEVRDARIPLSSSNPMLEELAKGKKRLIVLNKAELADLRLFPALQRYFQEQGHMCAYCSATDPASMARVIAAIKQSVSVRFRTGGAMFMIVGMPNVGKSSILNALRRKAMPKDSGKRGNVAKVSATPGCTRSVGNFQVSDDPALYLVDTPGVMVPRVTNVEAGMNLVLTGCLMDKVVGEVAAADYMLFKLNSMGDFRYVKHFRLNRPVDDVYQFLEQVAAKRGRGAVWDDDVAAGYVLAAFRSGKLGRVMLDPLHKLLTRQAEADQLTAQPRGEPAEEAQLPPIQHDVQV